MEGVTPRKLSALFCLVVLTLALFPALGALAANDPLFAQQWGLHRIQAEPAWGPGNAGAGVAVAVVDTGVNLAHEDLAGKSAGSFNCMKGTDPQRDPDCPPTELQSDDSGHGTQVAGVVGASANNGRGVAAVAPSAGIMSLKALDAEGQGDPWDVARAIRFAAGKARVINLSLGYDFGVVGVALHKLDSKMSEAISYATSRGSLVVAASGNRYFASSYSGLPDLLIVGASGPDDSRSLYSESSHILAPGGSGACPGPADRCILTTGKNNANYISVAGTSFAAPHVSGVAALLFSQAPGRSPSDVRHTILATADHVAGGSRVNAARAVGAPAASAGGGVSGPGVPVQGSGDGAGSPSDGPGGASPAETAAAAGARATSAPATGGTAAAPGAEGAPGAAQPAGTLVLGAPQNPPPDGPPSSAVGAGSSGSGAGSRAARPGGDRTDGRSGLALAIPIAAGLAAAAAAVTVLLARRRRSA